MVYILVIVFFIAALFSLLPIENKTLKEIILYFLAFILIFIAAFRGEDVDKDYIHYIDYFRESDFASIEPSFVIISRILKFFTLDSISIFIMFAFLGVLIKVKAIKQLTDLWLLSLVIYISYFFILHEMTQIRAGIASAILLLCIKPIYDRDWKRFLILVLIAVSFHYSAVMIIPFWFLGNKSRKIWLLLSIPIAYLIYFTHVNFIVFLPIPGIKEKLDLYKQLQEMGDDQWTAINVFNLLFLARIVIFYFVLWKYDLIASQNQYVPILLKIYCIALVCFLFFATMPVFAFRINELCSIVEIILIPQIFYVFKPDAFGKATVIFIGMGLIFIILFYSKLISS